VAVVLMLSADDLCVDLTCDVCSTVVHTISPACNICVLAQSITLGKSQKVKQTTLIFDFNNYDDELFVCD
jgi:hypothetical protein